MRLSLQATMILGFVFSMVCIAVAINGYASIPPDIEAAAIADAHGFAAFWGLLGCIAFGFAAASWWLLRGAGSEARTPE